MKTKIALMIGASACAGLVRVGVNGKVKEYPRDTPLSVDPEVYEALRNSTENVHLISDAPAEGEADEGTPVVGGVTLGESVEDGRPDLIDKDAGGVNPPAGVDLEADADARDAAEAALKQAAKDQADAEARAAADAADTSGPVESGNGSAPQGGDVAVYTGEIPADLIRWAADDSETGKKEGAIVTNDDLRAIAVREGVEVEGDDNKATLQGKIAADRAAKANG